MNFNFLYGTVMAIDNSAVDGNGNIVPTIHIKSDLAGEMLPVPWVPSGPMQIMPMVGHRAFVVRIADYDNRLIHHWGNNAAHIRKGDFGLSEGEAVFQSDSGLGYVKLDKSGGVELVTGDTSSTMRGDADGWNMDAPNITLQTAGGMVLALTENGEGSLAKVDANGKKTSHITLDKDENLTIDIKGDIVLKGKKIALDGKVAYGPGASDPTVAAGFGKVVTAGPAGTHQFDYVTGAPIIGSENVTAAP